MAMPRRSIPSISGMIAFEATARHLSFSQAAADLALTQGAVSKRVNRLEAVLGVQLIARDTHRISLTTVGENYLRHVQALLASMERSVSDVVNQAAGVESIAISAPGIFSQRWLIPRLSGFYRNHPGVQINICADGGGRTSLGVPVDGQVSLALGPLPNAKAVALFAEDLLAVASPEFLQAECIAKAADLAPNHLLQLSGRMHLWAYWLNNIGLGGDRIFAGTAYDTNAMLLSAAKCGHGVALLPRFAVAEYLASGALTVVGAVPPMSEYTYWFKIPSSRALSASTRAFADWLALQGAEFTPIRLGRESGLSDDAKTADSRAALR